MVLLLLCLKQHLHDFHLTSFHPMANTAQQSGFTKRQCVAIASLGSIGMSEHAFLIIHVMTRAQKLQRYMHSSLLGSPQSLNLKFIRHLSSCSLRSTSLISKWNIFWHSSAIQSLGLFYPEEFYLGRNGAVEYWWGIKSYRHRNEFPSELLQRHIKQKGQVPVRDMVNFEPWLS